MINNIDVMELVMMEVFVRVVFVWMFVDVVVLVLWGIKILILKYC